MNEQTIFVVTPDYELEKVDGIVVEQLLSYRFIGSKIEIKIVTIKWMIC